MAVADEDDGTGEGAGDASSVGGEYIVGGIDSRGGGLTFKSPAVHIRQNKPLIIYVCMVTLIIIPSIFKQKMPD